LRRRKSDISQRVAVSGKKFRLIYTTGEKFSYM
jgi:hypothetical protein